MNEERRKIDTRLAFIAGIIYGLFLGYLAGLIYMSYNCPCL